MKAVIEGLEAMLGSNEDARSYLTKHNIETNSTTPANRLIICCHLLELLRNNLAYQNYCAAIPNPVDEQTYTTLTARWNRLEYARRREPASERQLIKEMIAIETQLGY